MSPSEDERVLSSPDRSDRSVEPRLKKGSKARGPRRSITNVPRTLTYDGRSNWTPFKQKFMRYADASELTQDECLNSLCWCLTGKAADFRAIITEHHPDMNFRHLMRKLEESNSLRQLCFNQGTETLLRDTQGTSGCCALHASVPALSAWKTIFIAY